MTNNKNEKRLEERIWIPNGFKYWEGDLDTGFVVKDKDGNQFVYLPEMDQYISRYEISKGKYGVPKSVSGRKPWVSLNYYDARKVAQFFSVLYYEWKSEYEDNADFNHEEFTSDLIDDWGKIADELLRKTGKKSISIEVTYKTGQVLTGEIPELMIYNIDALVGANWCWTNEVRMEIENFRENIIAGGASDRYINGEIMKRLINTTDMAPSNRSFSNVAFRIVLKRKIVQEKKSLRRTNA